MNSPDVLQSVTATPPPHSLAPTASPRTNPKRRLPLILEFAASLKVTVFLFAAALFLVFIGTLAQVETSIWDVVNQYFRTVLVWIPLRVLTWYTLPAASPLSDIKIPYPGGWLLGGLMFTNLLAAHIVRFKFKWSRAGIIILHAGIILMMLGEFFTGMFAVEGMMSIEVGQTVAYVQDNRNLELAVEDVTDAKREKDDIVAMYLPAVVKKNISHPDLPFDIDVKTFMKNSHIETRLPRQEAQVTHGHGAQLIVEPRPEVSGTDPNQKIDDPAAIVELKTKDGKSLGTYTLSFIIGLIYGPDEVKVGDKTYEISLRPKRSYRDFTVRLDKADEHKHPNTTMAKDYSNYITLNDPDNGVVNREHHIWMNNPLRYRGETFFQANMGNHDGKMVTGLQVVRNRAWMLPYLSCIVVAFGMLLHFGNNLKSFLSKQARASS